MSWLQVVLEAFIVWLWLPLVLDRMSWRRKEGQLAEDFPALYYVTSALCHMRNDENELSKEGFNPCWTRVLFLSDRSSWNWWWWAPVVRLHWNLTGQLTCASAVGIFMWVGLAQLGLVVELLWACPSLQDEQFCLGWYAWAFVVSWLWKNKHSSHKFCKRIFLRDE